MRQVWFGLLAFALSVAPAHADAVYIPNPGEPGLYFDFTFGVARTLHIEPGSVGFVSAEIQNTGTLPLTFQVWDESKWANGYGWNSFDPAFAWIVSGITQDAGIRIAPGHTTDFNPAALKQDPDYTALSEVTITPGQVLDFDIFSVWLDPAVAVGFTGQFTAFGTFTYEGQFRSLAPPPAGIGGITIAAGATPSGAVQVFPLHLPRALPPNPNDPHAPVSPAQVPEPSTVLLVGLGLTMVLVGRKLTMQSVFSTKVG